MRNNFAQNSIDYMVYSNPKKVQEMLHDFGSETSVNPHKLVSLTKALIRQKGKEVLPKLLQLHPDKKAILGLVKSTKKCNSCNQDTYNEEDNFCGTCGHSNYNGSGDEDAFLDQFSDASDQEVKSYYNQVVKKSNTNPNDQKLASEVQMVWNELRQRKLVQTTPEKQAPTVQGRLTNLFKEEYVVIALAFISGYLIGMKSITQK
ncbi:hypothetical protein [Aquimarina pacifica]|uniref:hypothetical protein n=1 Tax=Aquimarina pacifica TaxID=1296415 RepID=UPI00046FFD70|nr:hypothetical protein [Aquimarina pacifica]